MDSTCDQLTRLTKLVENYKDIDAYRKKHKKLNYVQFDYAAAHDLTLFMIEPDFSFETLEQRINVILSALPTVKRIFAQPLVHLKEHNVILPVESVRTVNNDTLHHIASHSELWTNVTDNEIKPAKLLTKTYEDTYGIYENLVFCKVIDGILSFTRSNMRFLKELIYTNRTIEINLLERVNHLNYFLALGKLHIGYSQNFAAYYGTAVKCLNKLQFIYNTIVPRLKRPVYKKNKYRHAGIKIHKTNILAMHKEYHRIYKLALFFARHDIAADKETDDKDLVNLVKNYYFFCQALCVFAVGHFNFACDETKAFDLTKLNIDFVFKKWSLKMERLTVNEWQALSLTVKKNKTYKVILIPSLLNNNAALVQTVKAETTADEYIVCSPYEDCEADAVLIDITAIESFRRLQQILLRAMIYADTEHDDCPFCNNRLSVNGERSAAEEPVYECISCRTEIHTGRCPDTNKPYYYTKIAGLSPKRSDDEEEDWIAKRKAESKMHFRNITDTDDAFDPVCPHCGKIHERSDLSPD